MKVKFTCVRLDNEKAVIINVKQISCIDINTRTVSMSNGDTFCIDDESIKQLIAMIW